MDVDVGLERLNVEQLTDDLQCSSRAILGSIALSREINNYGPKTLQVTALIRKKKIKAGAWIWSNLKLLLGINKKYWSYSSKTNRTYLTN